MTATGSNTDFKKLSTLYELIRWPGIAAFVIGIIEILVGWGNRLALSSSCLVIALLSYAASDRVFKKMKKEFLAARIDSGMSLDAAEREFDSKYVD